MKPTFLTRSGLSVGTFLALAWCAQAEPLFPNQIELRNTIRFAEAAGVAPNSMFNPRYFDGNVYVAQINASAFGRYRSGAQAPAAYLLQFATQRPPVSNSAQPVPWLTTNEQ